MPSTLWFGTAHRIVVLCHSTVHPTDQDWDEWLDALGRFVKQEGLRRLLVVSEGGGPSTAQRQKLTDLIRDFSADVKTAICGSSAVVRGITTALTWMMRIPLRPFRFDDRQSALDYLDVSTSDRADVLALIEQLFLSLRGEA